MAKKVNFLHPKAGQNTQHMKERERDGKKEKKV